MKLRVAYAFGVVLVLLGTSTTPLSAQDNAPFNKIEVRTLQPLSFSYQNAMDLLNMQSIANALEISVKIKQENVMVMAQIQFSNASADAFKNLLALQLVNRTSSNAQMADGAVMLSNIPQMLFLQPRSSGGVKHYTFNYSLLLKPAEVVLPTGNHNFSILFTLTPQ